MYKTEILYEECVSIWNRTRTKLNNELAISKACEKLGVPILPNRKEVRAYYARYKAELLNR